MSASVKAESSARAWLAAALVAAIIYPVVGVAFAFLDNGAGGPFGIPFWRLAAWVASALVFAAHFVYEQRRRSSPLRTAWHLSFAVALGAFLLAVWILVRGRMIGAPQRSLVAFALVLFPLFAGVPAFVIAVIAAGLRSRLHSAQ